MIVYDHQKATSAEEDLVFNVISKNVAKIEKDTTLNAKLILRKLRQADFVILMTDGDRLQCCAMINLVTNVDLKMFDIDVYCVLQNDASKRFVQEIQNLAFNRGVTRINLWGLPDKQNIYEKHGFSKKRILKSLRTGHPLLVEMGL